MLVGVILIMRDSTVSTKNSICVAPMVRPSTETEINGTITDGISIVVFPFVVSRTSHATIRPFDYFQKNIVGRIAKQFVLFLKKIKLK